MSRASMKFGSVLLFASALAAQVPYERIVNADREPGSWLTYSRNYLGHRFSPLDQITPANVSRLKVKWAYQFDVAESRSGAGFENRARAVALAASDPR